MSWKEDIRPWDERGDAWEQDVARYEDVDGSDAEYERGKDGVNLKTQREQEA